MSDADRKQLFVAEMEDAVLGAIGATGKAAHLTDENVAALHACFDQLYSVLLACYQLPEAMPAPQPAEEVTAGKAAKKSLFGFLVPRLVI